MSSRLRASGRILKSSLAGPSTNSLSQSPGSCTRSHPAVIWFHKVLHLGTLRKGVINILIFVCGLEEYYLKRSLISCSISPKESPSRPTHHHPLLSSPSLHSSPLPTLIALCLIFSSRPNVLGDLYPGALHFPTTNSEYGQRIRCTRSGSALRD